MLHISVSLASMGWLPMLLGKIPGNSHFGTLIVGRQLWERVGIQDRSHAGVIPREIAAGLSDTDILDRAIAADAERDGGVERGGIANSGIDSHLVPVRIDAALSGLNVPAEAARAATSASTQEVRAHRRGCG